MVNDRGRLVRVDFALPIEWNRMPGWLEARIASYAERFDWGWRPTSWDALRLLFGIQGREQWGEDANGWFVSKPIPPKDQMAVVHVAEELDCDYALSIDDGCFVLAPKGALR